ncbi:MAG: DUF434 domain-containing protein, partial [Planctomycetota bacterium]
ALALVGNRHDLEERQRIAVRRSACSDQSLHRRTRSRVAVAQCGQHPLGIDGYNLLITIESGLSGGPIFVGRDGAYRDLASVHGTYRKVEETLPAVRLIHENIQTIGVSTIDWYLDRPVSNSGRLKTLIAEVVESSGVRWNIELVDSPDRILADYDGVVASSDSWILDRCKAWTNLAGDIIDARLSDSWRVLMSEATDGPTGASPPPRPDDQQQAERE